MSLLLWACHAPPPATSKGKKPAASAAANPSPVASKPSVRHWDKEKGFAMALPKGEWAFLAEGRLSGHGSEVVSVLVGGDDCLATVQIVSSPQGELETVVKQRLDAHFPGIEPDHLEPLQYSGRGAMRAELSRVEGGVPTRYRTSMLLGWHRGTRRLYEVRVQSHSELFVEARRCFDTATAAFDIMVDEEGKPVLPKPK